ncbi:hypothetical protein CL633_00960 [bacterium]|nr:hypothetical protein [bacterium]
MIHKKYAWAKKIWNYHKLNHKLEKADLILVLGSHDLRVAKRGAELFLKNYAPLIVFSGGFGTRPSRKTWDTPEAEIFAQVAIKMGVPKNKILQEKKSTNTGENIIFTKKLLAQKNIKIFSVIVVTKPYMERRAYATFRKNWSKAKVIVTSPKLSFENYPDKEVSKYETINLMVGDLQRIKIYPKMGFQIKQKIPKHIWKAYHNLVVFGYDKHLI